MEQLSSEQLKGKIDKIFFDLFEVPQEKIKPKANLFEDLGLDSLDAIDLVIAFQSNFKIKPENSELQSIRTIKDVYDLVERYYEKISKNP